MSTNQTNKHENTDTNAMTVREHLLMEYASGTLNEAVTLFVASFVSSCRTSQSTLADYENIGGLLIETMPCHDKSTHVDEACLNSVLERIETLENDTKASKTCNKTKLRNDFIAKHGCLPHAVRRHLEKADACPEWSRMNKGIHCYQLPLDDHRCTENYSAVLLQIEPGVKTRAHSHKGREYTLVLEGAYHDETGSYSAGDMIINDEHIHHQPMADKVTGCICLVILEAPVEYTGLLSKILNIFRN